MDQKAESAATFVGSIGVNTHSFYSDTSYANTQMVIQDMAYLGLDNVRDADPGLTTQAYMSPFEQEAAAGLKFDFILQAYDYTVSSGIAFLNALETADPGSITAVEGPNEVNSYDQFGGYSGLATVVPMDQAIQQAVTSDPLLNGLPIYENTLLNYTQAASVGNLSAYVTYGNAHIYAGSLGPQSAINVALPIESESTPGLPMVVTETGYNTDAAATVASDSVGVGVSLQVQAKYTLDTLFDYAAAGVSMTYLYELLDDNSDPTDTTYADHWGLFNADGSAKPAAVAIHNLTTILADNSATADTFTPGTLNYTVTGLPVYNYSILNGTVYENIGGNTYLLEKSNGAFDLAVWAEPAIVSNTGADIVAAPSDVTVSFTQQYQTVEVFDPLVSSAPIEVLHNVSQVQLLITDHPLIVEIEPNGTSGAAPVQQQTVLTIATPGDPAVNDNATLMPFSNVVVTDTQISGAESASITLTGANGVPTDANGTLSGSGLTKMAAGVYTITAASPAALSAALQALVFTPTQHEVAPGQTVTTQLTLAVSDGTNVTGASTTVVATAQETTPTIAGTTASQAITDVATAQPFGHVTIADPDYGAQESVTITLQGAGGSATDANGTLSGSGLTKTGVGTYSLAANTPAAISAELDSLVFTPAVAEVPTGQSVTTTFALAVSDGRQTVTNTATTVSATATGPTFSGVTGTASLPDTGTVDPYAYLKVTDARSGGSETATIKVTGANGSLTDANGLLSGSGLTKTGTGTYTITAASPAAMTAALEALVFTPTRHEVAPGQAVTTRLSLTVSDGVHTGSPYTPTAIVATAQDTAPTIAGVSGGQGITDVATVQPLSHVTIADPDYGARESVTITLKGTNGSATDANGLLSGSGLTKTGVGTYSLAANTPAAISAELDNLVFTPTKAEVPTGQSVTTTFALAVSDGILTVTNSATTVTATATGPTFSGVTGTASLPDSGTVNPYYFLKVTDARSGGSETATIKVTGANGSLTDANGLLSGSGLTKTGTGTYTITAASPAAMTAALEALVFTPTRHEVAPGQTVTTQLSLAVSDGVQTSSPAPTSIVVTAQETAPTIAGTTASQAITDVATAQPFGHVTIADPDYGARESVIITLKGANGSATDANGLLSGSGLTKTGVGTYSLAANTPAAISSELDSLVFTPTKAEVPTGQSVTTTFTLAVSDGSQTVTNAATTVTATATALTQSSSLTFISEQNNTTIHASTGAEVFTFGPATFGHDTITGFNPALDFLQISKTLVSSFATFQADETSVSGGTMVTLNANNSIFLPGVTPGTINSQHVALF